MWFALCDKLHSSAEAARAGVAGVGAYALAGSWCSDHRTDGAIPREIAHRFAPAAVWKKVEAAGLVRATEEGYELVDYLVGNMSRAQIEARAAAKSEAKQKAGRAGGLASGKARAKQAGSRDEAETKQAGSKTKPPAPSIAQEDTPPPTPPSGEGSARKARSGDWKKSLDRVRGVYDAAIGAATGRPFASKRPGGPPENDPLNQIVKTHSAGLRLEALDAWVIETASAFVAAIPTEEARFYGQHSPDGCLKWLNAGRPDCRAPPPDPPKPPPEEDIPKPSISREESLRLAEKYREELERRRVTA